MHHWISVVCGPKFTKFFSLNMEWLWLNEFFSDFRCVDPFRRYSRPKLKVVKKRVKIWAFNWPSKYLGSGHSKSCTHIITPASRHVVWKKFRKVIPTGPEVIWAQTLNFMPNFKFSPLNVFGGTLSPMGVR